MTDRFGDNGLISVVLGHIKGNKLHLDLWLMSCRVLKRDMEFAMLDCLVERARMASVTEIIGYYIPSAKNGMVADHYEKLGFTFQSDTETPRSTEWRLDVSSYETRNKHISIGKEHNV